MNLTEFAGAAVEAWTLLAAYPIRWIAVMVAFLILVEGLMFVPYVGFVIKLSAVGIVTPQLITMFAAAANRQAPSPLDLFDAFSLPWITLIVLACAALVPFVAAILFLYTKGGPQAIRYFLAILSRRPLHRCSISNIQNTLCYFSRYRLPFSLEQLRSKGSLALARFLQPLQRQFLIGFQLFCLRQSASLSSGRQPEFRIACLNLRPRQ